MSIEDDLRRHLEERYGLSATGLERLEEGVYRVDRSGDRSWVVRVFPAGRTPEQVRGDADILGFLQDHEFPAERLAVPDAVSELGTRGVLVTEYVEGTPPRRDAATMYACGELLGRLANLPVVAGAVARPAGALHHYSLEDGAPARELAAARSWLAAVSDRVLAQGRELHDSVAEQVVSNDDGAGLPEALIHPDPDLKNVLVDGDGGAHLIDWTGAGRGPRVASLSVLLWSAAMKPGGWSEKRVDAVVAGYRTQVALDEHELARLGEVMQIRPLIFACWRYRHALLAGEPVDGTEWWWPSAALTTAIADRARQGFADQLATV